MSASKWIPGDDELDALARTLPVAERGGDRVEQERTALLAQAAGAAQVRRGSRTPILVASAAFAAAAAVILWLAVRPGPPLAPKESITALGPAQYERVATWPDFRVRLDDGRIDVRVAKLLEGERFRVTTADAEVEAGGAQFIVAADHGQIASVSVGEGRVEVRWAHEPPVFLAAGQSWSPTRTVQRDEVTPPPTRVAEADIAVPAGPDPAPPAPAPKHPAHVAPARPTAGATSEPKRAPTESPKPAAPAARPGEADFRAGIASLRAGDAAAAVKSFASACKAAEKDALGEDACFWLGAAAKRANQTRAAREALTHFLSTFPSSARAGEASALLGWLLYDAGDLDGARQRFELAAHDRVAKVKESAERGLEAIKRSKR